MKTLLMCSTCGMVIVGCELPTNEGVLQRYCSTCSFLLTKSGCPNLTISEERTYIIKCELCLENENRIDYDD